MAARLCGPGLASPVTGVRSWSGRPRSASSGAAGGGEIVEIFLPHGRVLVMSVSSALRGIARHPVVAFMLISLAAYFATAAIPPIVDAEILPFDLPQCGLAGIRPQTARHGP